MYTYNELQITPNQSGMLSLEFGPDSSNSTGWDIYIAGTSQCILPNTTQTASSIDAGIESSDTANTFVNGTDLEQLEYVDSTGAFIDWTNPGILTPQNQTVWTSRFTSTAGNPTLVYNHP